MDFNSGASKSGLSSDQRNALMGNIKEQLAMVQAQELLQVVGDKCFKMCIQKPGSSLSSSDQVDFNDCQVHIKLELSL